MPRFIAALLFASLLTGCSAAAPRDVSPAMHPADASAGIRDTRYSGVIGDYRHREPADPKPWRKPNEERAPGTEGGS